MTASNEDVNRVRETSTADAPWEPIDDGDVVAGHPSTRTLPLFESDGPVEAGIWEMSEGAARDVEVDEVCLILAGRASLVINDHPSVEITAGSFVTLRAGDRTVWTVHQPLRKFYVVTTL
ncbi:cupin domain-containing protein [Subtercola frigoramans]|uniref:Cupin superfamily protein n=1 Tax=Subtercola frigoramans TaxID=120298 RepID=A0ABS2L207_9MICO|nr:cupin domain-containing protein [Subtercola frigoramans]MBM7470810.1 putative cupin superfamily protein [Subtercola frigoramans]